MNAKLEAKETRFDALKWIVVAFLVVVGVVGNHYFAAQPIIYRVLALLVLGGAAAFVALQTVKGQAFFLWPKKRVSRSARWSGRLVRKLLRPR